MQDWSRISLNSCWEEAWRHLMVVLRIMWWNSPGLLPPFCILQAIKNWRCTRAGKEANYITVIEWHHNDITMTSHRTLTICPLLIAFATSSALILIPGSGRVGGSVSVVLATVALWTGGGFEGWTKPGLGWTTGSGAAFFTNCWKSRNIHVLINCAIILGGGRDQVPEEGEWLSYHRTCKWCIQASQNKKNHSVYSLNSHKIYQHTRRFSTKWWSSIYKKQKIFSEK